MRFVDGVGTMKAVCWWMAVLCISMVSAGCRESTESWIEKANKEFKAGNNEKAILYCTNALALEPDNALAHFSLGWIYKLDGRADEAISEFKKTIALNPKFGGAYNHLGDLYLNQGMIDDAIAAYTQAVSFQPESALTHYNLGIAYTRKGDLPSAADSLFEGGLVAILYSERGIATNAYNALREIGNEQLAEELQEVLNPWFDPAQEVVTQPGP